MTIVFEPQYVPGPIPLGADPVITEWVARELKAIHDATHDKVGRLGQTGCWDDNLGPLTAAKVGGGAGGSPGWKQMQSGMYAWAFDDSSTEELWVNYHINHDYMQNSMIYPHVHWVPEGTSTGTVRWGIEYSFGKGYSQEIFPDPAGATDAGNTVYIEQAGSGTALTHQIAENDEDNGIPGSIFETDGVLMVRFFRDGGHANDTFVGDAFGIMFDLHYQMERIGTINRNGPDFYSR